MKSIGKKCVYCEKDFIIFIKKGYNGREKYCSLKCKSKDYYNIYYEHFVWKKEKPCEVCGNIYMPQKSVSYTCSRKCCNIRNKRLYKEQNKIYNNEWVRKDRIKNPEKYRFRTKQRRNLLRDISGSSKKFSKSFTLKQWENLKLEYNFTCPDCFKKEPEIKLTIDHIIPLSKFGKHTLDNIQPLCFSCNSRKKDKIINLI